MEKVLVTGGAGAVGYHLAKKLADDGCDVTIVDNFSRSSRDSMFESLISRENVHFILGDLCDPTLVSGLPLDCSYVFHMAALNGTQNFYEKPFDVLESCTLPNIFLLKHYANSTTLKRFLYAGSSEAYASTISLLNWQIPTDETVPLSFDDPTNIRWSYGASKMHGEFACFSAAEQFKIPAVVVRYHNVYGIRMGDKHVIPDFIERAQQDVFELYGYEDTRSFIYVTDAVEATILLSKAEWTKCEIVNIGGHPEITMLDLGKLIMKYMGKEGEIACFPSPTGSVKRRCPCLNKLHKLTGFQQKIGLEEGIKMILKG